MGWFRFQELQSRWESLEATSDTGLDGDAAVKVAATQKDEVETAAETGGDGDAAEEALGSHEEILTELPRDMPQREQSQMWFGWMLVKMLARFIQFRIFRIIQIKITKLTEYSWNLVMKIKGP